MIKAFTLTEVMITMIVSSLVILLAYATLQMMNHYFFRTGRNSEVNAERLNMRTVMARDVDVGDSIHYTDGLLTIYLKGKIIKWTSDSAALVRNVMVGDFVDVKHFMVGENVLFASESNSTDLVGMVEVELTGEMGDHSLFRFLKNYGLAMDVNHPKPSEEAGDGNGRIADMTP